MVKKIEWEKVFAGNFSQPNSLKNYFWEFFTFPFWLSSREKCQIRRICWMSVSKFSTNEFEISVLNLAVLIRLMKILFNKICKTPFKVSLRHIQGKPKNKENQWLNFATRVTFRLLGDPCSPDIIQLYKVNVWNFNGQKSWLFWVLLKGFSFGLMASQSFFRISDIVGCLFKKILTSHSKTQHTYLRDNFLSHSIFYFNSITIKDWAIKVCDQSWEIILETLSNDGKSWRKKLSKISPKKHSRQKS